MKNKNILHIKQNIKSNILKNKSNHCQKNEKVSTNGEQIIKTEKIKQGFKVPKITAKVANVNVNKKHKENHLNFTFTSEEEDLDILESKKNKRFTKKINKSLIQESNSDLDISIDEVQNSITPTYDYTLKFNEL